MKCSGNSCHSVLSQKCLDWLSATMLSTPGMGVVEIQKVCSFAKVPNGYCIVVTSNEFGATHTIYVCHCSLTISHDSNMFESLFYNMI